ncbi:MAG: carboxypeptidase-like regulatory domain-containing protein, partial [Candidatus Acidiferrum sp.]
MIKLFGSIPLLLLLSTVLQAQRGSGEILGSVTDASGQSVSNARVKAVESNTSWARETVTDDRGFYTISELQPGEYDVTVEAPGFAEFLAVSRVTLGSHITIDPVLSLKPVKESTTVVAERGIQVETRTQMLSQVISGVQITELPSLTRDPYDFVALAGDVSPADSGLGVGVAINGQRGASTNITLDGAENTNSYEAVVGQAVPLDSVSEFRISQSTFTA